MKRIMLLMVVLVFLIIPVFAFSDVAIGGAFFKNGSDLGSGSLFENVIFGANGRLKFGTLQLDALGLYNSSSPSSVDLIMNAEGNFNLLFVNLSGGVGPNFNIPTSGSNVFTYGVNVKVNIDFRILKKLSLGVSYVYLIDDIAQKNGASTSRSLIGATVLIW